MYCVSEWLFWHLRVILRNPIFLKMAQCMSWPVELVNNIPIVSFTHPSTHSLTLLPTHMLAHSLACSFTCLLIHLLAHSLACSLTCLLIHLLTRPTHLHTRSLTHSLTHSLVHPLTHSLTHTLTHALTRPPTYTLAHSPIHSPGIGFLYKAVVIHQEHSRQYWWFICSRFTLQIECEGIQYFSW